MSDSKNATPPPVAGYWYRSNGAPSPGIVRSQTVPGFHLGRSGAVLNNLGVVSVDKSDYGVSIDGELLVADIISRTRIAKKSAIMGGWDVILWTGRRRQISTDWFRSTEAPQHDTRGMPRGPGHPDPYHWMLSRRHIVNPATRTGYISHHRHLPSLPAHSHLDRPQPPGQGNRQGTCPCGWWMHSACRRHRRLWCRLWSYQKTPPHRRGNILRHRNAPVVGGLAGGAAHLQSCQAFLAAPASTALAEASRGVKIVALMALAYLCGLPSLLFTLLPLSIATDFQSVALLAHHRIHCHHYRSCQCPCL